MRTLLALVTCALCVAGCGGGGDHGLSPGRLRSLLQERAAGIQNIPNGPKGRGRSKQVASKSAPFARAGRSVPVTRDPGDRWFDEDYGLWAEDFMDGDPNGVHDWGTHYFASETSTDILGTDAWHSVWNEWPMVDDETITIHAGPMRGMHLELHSLLNDDGSGTETSNALIPGEGRIVYEMAWGVDGRTAVDVKYTHPDASWVRYQGTPLPDMENGYIVTDSAGYRLDLHFLADYAGSGTFTGPNALLPATLVWDANGTGTITWADGSVTDFQNWDF